jgi:hypothetical protein
MRARARALIVETFEACMVGSEGQVGCRLRRHSTQRLGGSRVDVCNASRYCAFSRAGNPEHADRALAGLMRERAGQDARRG